MSATPDLAEPILGWRAWSARTELDALILHSPVFPCRWPSGRRLAATCANRARFGVIGRVPPIEAHEAPGEDCGCGIYAARSPERALRYAGGLRPVRGTRAVLVGEVALWGRVIECEHGWRGALAYPRRLFLLRGRDPHALCRALAGYGVPVETMNGTMAAALRRNPRAGSADVGSTRAPQFTHPALPACSSSSRPRSPGAPARG
jgi:hypothetical protein